MPLAVGASSQYILQSLFSSDNLNDGKAEIPLLKGLEQFQLPFIRDHTLDAENDFESIYETLKYTSPLECKDCPILNQGQCQKVYKVRITTDLRKNTATHEDQKYGRRYLSAEQL